MSNFPTEPFVAPASIAGGVWETILPNLSRRRFRVHYQRQRLELADGDFIDLDFAQHGSRETFDTCVLALHGLEGDAYSPYIKSFAKSMKGTGLDFVAMNLRGCSGELNRLPRFYHSGETGDLAAAIAYLEQRYKRILLLGFSLGGNVVLKYLGQIAERVPATVVAAVAVSAPVDLESSARRIGEKNNAFFMKRFIRLLSRKIEAKARLYPDIIDAKRSREMSSFEEFDGFYTAPLNGFSSAVDYWSNCSALPDLKRIRVPSLLINARSDPFLTPLCYPVQEEIANPHFYTAYPEFGGHLGFFGKRRQGKTWHERVALDFFRKLALQS